MLLVKYQYFSPIYIYHLQCFHDLCIFLSYMCHKFYESSRSIFCKCHIISFKFFLGIKIVDKKLKYNFILHIYNKYYLKNL